MKKLRKRNAVAVMDYEIETWIIVVIVCVAFALGFAFS